MPTNDIVGHRKEPAVGTLGALDARLLADATHPLVGTRWRIARAPGPPALESARVNVFATAEERTEQRDLGLRRGSPIDGLRDRRHVAAGDLFSDENSPSPPISGRVLVRTHSRSM